MNTKYLNPIAYYRKLKHIVAKLTMAIGISLVVTTNVDKFRILFWATSYKEYMLRAKLSYKREKVTMHWLRVLVDPNDVVYDIGANVGAYSLYAGNIVSGGNGQVLAFEPAFTNFFPLGRNIELNSLNQFVIPYSLAFGASTYASSMFLRSTERGEAMHGMTRPVSEGNKPVIAVPIVSIASDTNMKRCSRMKASTNTTVKAKKPGISRTLCSKPISAPSKFAFSITKLFNRAIQLEKAIGTTIEINNKKFCGVFQLAFDALIAAKS